MNNKKTQLRKQVQLILKNMAEDKKTALSRQASSHLLCSPLWEKAQTICLFVSYGAEIQTQPLLEAAWEQGKTVYLPKCWPHRPGAMDFFRCSGWEDFERGLFGILEPRETTHPLAPPEFPDVIVVPGIAFTVTGQRLGKGGGYYDRFMASELCQNAVRIGFAYSQQIVDALPVEVWDLPLHYLCTDLGLIPVRNMGK